MATIYSIGSQSVDDMVIRDKMRAATFSDGRLVYSLATGVSLLIFYALSMQCMSTLAVVKKELGAWKWPVIQFFFMSGLAYLLAWVAYQWLK